MLTLTYLVEKRINQITTAANRNTNKLIKFPDIGPNALAHVNISGVDLNWSHQSEVSYYQNFLNKVPVYEIAKPADPKKPIFFIDNIS